MGVPAIAELMVPPWYLKAYLSGVPQAKRRDMVREQVLKDLRAQAQARGEAAPDTVDEKAVALTYEMYEFSLSLGAKD